ncbi:MAG: CoA transferase, partial [Betaproteobacteria bacterium]|nr:CoA transferase [Betaproteobacteria bacterium]
NLHQGTSLWWHVQNRHKKSVTVNLRTEQGREVARRLLRDADILIENFRAGALEKWGLGYDVLSADNPGLVMLRLSGFGQDGPYRDQTGFGSVGESMGGMRYVTGFPDRPPVRPNLSLGDALAAMHGVIGAMMALHQRNAHAGEGGSQKGRGQVVDVALYEAVFNMMEGALPEFDMFGAIREREGTTLTGIVPSNTYPTADGHYIVIGGNGDSIFKRLMSLVGREDLTRDPSVADNAGRVKRSGELDGAIGAWTSRHAVDEVVKALNAAQVPNGKIYTMADVVRDPQYLARQMVREIILKDGARLKVPGVVPKLSRTPGEEPGRGPELGEHTEEVLRSYGFAATEIANLRAAKAL